MDRALVIRAQGGDHDAFAALAAASLARLNSIAGLIVRDRGAAEEAVQDALVDAWKNLRALRDPDRFDAWLHRLLVRACYDRARRDRRRVITEIRLDPTIDPAAPEDARSFDLRDQLERGLQRLSAEQRAAVVLVYYLDLPLAEAAEVLDIPLGTMKSRLSRSITALRALVEADDRDPIRATGSPA